MGMRKEPEGKLEYIKVKYFLLYIRNQNQQTFDIEIYLSSPTVLKSLQLKQTEKRVSGRIQMTQSTIGRC